jgi:hypothetical protein
MQSWTDLRPIRERFEFTNAIMHVRGMQYVVGNQVSASLHARCAPRGQERTTSRPPTQLGRPGRRLYTSSASYGYVHAPICVSSVRCLVDAPRRRSHRRIVALRGGEAVECVSTSAKLITFFKPYTTVHSRFAFHRTRSITHGA